MWLNYKEGFLICRLPPTKGYLKDSTGKKGSANEMFEWAPTGAKGFERRNPLPFRALLGEKNRTRDLLNLEVLKQEKDTSQSASKRMVWSPVV